jgi:outer membrane immunogenic protein
MQKALLSGVCAVALCTSAFAADLPAKPSYKSPPLAPAPVFSWSGCYVGGNLGYGHESRTWSGTATTPTTMFVSQRTSGDGFVGGGQLGCDYQWSNVVFGIAGMWDASDVSKSNSVNGIPGAFLRDKVKSFETVTGRIGWAINRNLVYALGGGAWERVSGTIDGSGLGLATETHSWSNSGWVVGAGWEYAFTNNLSAKIEYDYMDFANKTVSYPITSAGPVQFSRQNLQTILVGLNYRFGLGPTWAGAK